MDNFDLKKYLAEGKLTEESTTDHYYIKFNDIKKQGADRIYNILKKYGSKTFQDRDEFPIQPGDRVYTGSGASKKIKNPHDIKRDGENFKIGKYDIKLEKPYDGGIYPYFELRDFNYDLYSVSPNGEKTKINLTQIK
jgi:hypothetical protein